MFTKIIITLMLFWLIISIIDILLSIYTKQTQLREIKATLGSVEHANLRSRGSKVNYGGGHKAKGIIQRFKEALGFGA